MRESPRPDRLALDDPKMLPFLPMLYVAWADGVLDDVEVVTIFRKIRSDDALRIESWLDPAHPPSAGELQRMLRIVRERAARLDAPEKLDLVGLGLRIAQADGRVVDEEREALVQLVDSLGLAGTEAARQLLVSRRPARRAPEPKADFDLDALRRVLDGERGDVRRRLFALLSEDGGFQRPQDILKDDYREMVLGWCERLADAGLGGQSYAPEYGGDGDLEAFITTFENLAYFDLSLVVKFGVQYGLFGGAIQNLGTERHHRELLPRVSSLELPGCFAMTETGHGSNVNDIETTATWIAKSGEIEVHTPSAGARKDYIGNAACHGRLAVVFAQLVVGDEEHGVHAVLVPIRDDHGAVLDGVTIEDCGEKMGLNGVDNGRLAFDRVRVPRTNLLDRFASLDAEGSYTSPIASPGKRFFTMLGTLVGGRVSVGLAALSASKSALAIALRYGVRRRQFGPGGAPEIKLLDYPSHQRRLLPRLATTYALHFALAELRRDYVASDPEERRTIELDAAGLKAYATWHATDTIQACREACGGQGYLAENRFAALKADTDVFTTFEGDNTVLLLLVAKGMLSGLRQRFEGMGFVDMARWIGGQAVEALIGARAPRASESSREFLSAAFQYREEHLLATVARRLKKRLGRGLEPAQAMLECQDHLLAAAKARVENQVYCRFVAAVDKVESAPERRILATVCNLYALSRLETDRAFFMESEWLDPARAKAIRKAVLQLGGEVRTQALPLVDAFGIPEALLGAPIAR